MLDERKMRLSEIVHEEADLLNYIFQIWMRESEVMKSICDAHVL
jgi:hypothetical protein